MLRVHESSRSQLGSAELQIDAFNAIEDELVRKSYFLCWKQLHKQKEGMYRRISSWVMKDLLSPAFKIYSYTKLM